MPRFNQGYRRSPELTQEQVKEIQRRVVQGESRSLVRAEFKQGHKRFADVVSGRYEIKKWGKVL